MMAKDDGTLPDRNEVVTAELNPGGSRNNPTPVLESASEESDRRFTLLPPSQISSGTPLTHGSASDVIPNASPLYQSASATPAATIMSPALGNWKVGGSQKQESISDFQEGEFSKEPLLLEGPCSGGNQLEEAQEMGRLPMEWASVEIPLVENVDEYRYPETSKHPSVNLDLSCLHWADHTL